MRRTLRRMRNADKAHGAPMRTGDRVVLVDAPRWRGVVSFARSGFVFVRWDHGGDSLVWGADLTLDPT
jgi:hypothetical protein